MPEFVRHDPVAALYYDDGNVDLPGTVERMTFVGDAARTAVRAVEVEIRVVELMRTRKILRH